MVLVPMCRSETTFLILSIITTHNNQAKRQWDGDSLQQQMTQHVNISSFVTESSSEYLKPPQIKIKVIVT